MKMWKNLRFATALFAVTAIGYGSGYYVFAVDCNANGCVESLCFKFSGDCFAVEDTKPYGRIVYNHEGATGGETYQFELIKIEVKPSCTPCTLTGGGSWKFLASNCGFYETETGSIPRYECN
jgi:hypothetical protein